jgi:hypothetical protein
MIESRPPSLTWSRSSPPQPNQPPLDLTDHEPDVPEAAGPNHRGIRVSIVKARWAAKQRPGYPMPLVEYHTCSGADSGAAGPPCGFSSDSLKMCPSERPGRDLDVQPRPSDLGRLLASVRRIQAASWRCPAAAVIVARSTRWTGRKPYPGCLDPPLELSERAEQILASRRLAVADEVDELSRRSHCAENRKSVLIGLCKISIRLSTAKRMQAVGVVPVVCWRERNTAALG